MMLLIKVVSTSTTGGGERSSLDEDRDGGREREEKKPVWLRVIAMEIIRGCVSFLHSSYKLTFASNTDYALTQSSCDAYSRDTTPLLHPPPVPKSSAHSLTPSTAFPPKNHLYSV